MRLLVDGLNVIGSKADGWWRDRTAAMRSLVHDLERFARDHDDEEVTVVMDGRPRDVGEHERVDVVFAPGGPNAGDDEIARRVAADPAPEDLVVVTSDRDLVRRVQDAGGRIESSGAFRRRLEGD